MACRPRLIEHQQAQEALDLLIFSLAPALSSLHQPPFNYNHLPVRMQYKIIFSVGLLALVDFVAGHGAIVMAKGDAGGAGSAIGSQSLSNLPFQHILIVSS